MGVYIYIHIYIYIYIYIYIFHLEALPHLGYKSNAINELVDNCSSS